MEKRIAELKEKMVDFDNLNNEGNSDSYNPYRDQLEKLQEDFLSAKDVTWTKEVTMARRAEWKAWVIANAKNGKVNANLVGKKINEQGWNLDNLKNAIASHNL